MSEWYDNQRKSNGNFRKLLQERLDKNNPRRKLAKDEATKLAKLKENIINYFEFIPS